MNDKISLQDIARLLAGKKGMGIAEAEAFVKAFFHVVADALETDKVLKIKGFGTFKLVDIDSRESVDVNSGQRITIQNHTKITFVPDPRLRDGVNKPFSHFEAVVLHEGVCFDDAPVEPNPADAGHAGTDAPLPPGEAAQGSGEMPAGQPSRPVAEEEKADEPVLPSAESPQENASQPVAETGKGRRKWLYAAGSAAALLAAGLVFFLASGGTGEGKLADNYGKPAALPAATRPQPPASDTVAVRTDSVAAPEETPDIDTTRTIITGVRKNAATVMADSTHYVIVGTMATYRLQPGETLTMVSKRFYETKDLWPYLVMHNRDRIRNPHQVPQGIVLRIPALRDKK